MWGEGENNREWRKGWKEDDALGYSGRSRECSQVVEKEGNFHGNQESGEKRKMRGKELKNWNYDW